MAYQIIQCIHVGFWELQRMRPNQGLFCFKPLQTWVSLEHSSWMENSSMYCWLSVVGNVCLFCRPIRQEVTSPLQQHFLLRHIWRNPIPALTTPETEMSNLMANSEVVLALPRNKNSGSWCWKRANKEIQPCFSEKRAFSMLQRQEGGELTEGRFFFLIVESSAWKKNCLYLWKIFPSQSSKRTWKLAREFRADCIEVYYWDNDPAGLKRGPGCLLREKNPKGSLQNPLIILSPLF